MLRQHCCPDSVSPLVRVAPVTRLGSTSSRFCLQEAQSQTQQYAMGWMPSARVAVVSIWLPLLVLWSAVVSVQPVAHHDHHLVDLQSQHPDSSIQVQQAASKLANNKTPGAAQHARVRVLHQQQHGQQTSFIEATSSASAPAQFSIPVPPPGQNVPAEPLVPLYSPDQLRLRLPVIEDVPVDRQIISLMEQMQQASHLNTTLNSEQLQNANPLLGRHGVLKLPDRTDPRQYPEGYVAICAIVKDQHKDIREWLEYHKYIGVSKVYVYDNNSTEPLTTVLKDYMHSGYVEYAFFTGQPRYRDLFRTSSQWWAYNDCIQRYRYRHRWMAFIDADEFIVFHDNSTDINTFMQAYDEYGGLAVNWVVFGSSGHQQRPQGGVLVNYKQCLPLDQEQNQHVKVIANTAHLMTVGDDPHRVYYKDGNYTVNELGVKVVGPKSPPSHTKIALYHYLTKSEGEYMLKMKRGSAAGNYKAPEFFYAINGLATSTCSRAISLGLKCCPSVLAELGPQGLKRVQQGIQAEQLQPLTNMGQLPQAH